ncbi:hypothetical protein AMTR_s00073p00170300 [Amborella trichopoda]|uniref:Uncharacterized protein n=1 Tax=Amborella trichopoda TaxID=13333 RepID=W1NQU8_AMBTC|nr:hypothetical protein AMTR_s00073p00170300 [Amborella trichopoda]
MALKRGAHVSKKSLSVPGTSPPRPPAKRARAEASMVMNAPPMISTSALRVEPKTNVAQLEMPSLTTFSLSHEPIRAPSPIVEAVTPPTARLVGSLVCPSLSIGDFLCTITEEGIIEAISEALAVEEIAPEVPAPATSEVESEVEPLLDVPSLELVVELVLEVPASEREKTGREDGRICREQRTASEDGKEGRREMERTGTGKKLAEEGRARSWRGQQEVAGRKRGAEMVVRQEKRSRGTMSCS